MIIFDSRNQFRCSGALSCLHSLNMACVALLLFLLANSASVPSVLAHELTGNGYRWNFIAKSDSKPHCFQGTGDETSKEETAEEETVDPRVTSGLEKMLAYKLTKRIDICIVFHLTKGKTLVRWTSRRRPKYGNSQP